MTTSPTSGRATRQRRRAAAETASETPRPRPRFSVEMRINDGRRACTTFRAVLGRRRAGGDVDGAGRRVLPEDRGAEQAANRREDGTDEEPEEQPENPA